MGKYHKRIQTCQACGRATNNAYICRRCSNELRDLLVGSREVDGQPGIIWYAKRLRESAYGQTRMERSAGARLDNAGYALFGNKAAADLLARINAALAVWEATVEALVSMHSHETGWVHTGSPTRDFERLEAKRARYIAAHVVLIRHHCADAHRLHAQMLEFARAAWRIINRPNDICCGPCPTMIHDSSINSAYAQSRDNIRPCGTLLYAEEGASTVVCPLCHTLHDVELLRDAMKTYVTDMLFTRADLVKLMETRLNDRIPQPTFTKLLRDGRLRPRKYEQEVNDKGEWVAVPMYTYNDVCEARDKPVPHNKIRSVS
jgi:LSD1 subclass zinc finger protein